MVRYVSLVLVAGLLAGCQAAVGTSPRVRADERAELAAFAARTEYPGAPETEGRFTALVDRNRQTVQIINPTEQPILNATVWINGQYVARVDSIPARSTVTLGHDRFYDRTGRSIADTRVGINTVDMQIRDQSYRLLGPAYN